MINAIRFIAAVRERLSKATPGPWKAAYERIREVKGEDCGKDDIAHIYATNRKVNADLIASAPSDLTKLTDALEVALEALEQYADSKKWKPSDRKFTETRG